MVSINCRSVCRSGNRDTDSAGCRRGEHTAEVCRDILHNEGEGLYFSCRWRKAQDIQGQEGEQRHIVCNEHGADEGDVDKGEHGHARALLQSPSRRRATAEKADVFKGAYNGQHAEQAGERAEIEIAGVLVVRRDYDAGYNGCGKSDG